MSGGKGCCLVSIDKITSVIDNTCATGINQSLDTGLVARFDYISRSLHIHTEILFFVALSNGRDWRACRVYYDRWFDLLEDFGQRGEIRYISADVGILEGSGGRGNVEHRNFALRVSSSD